MIFKFPLISLFLSGSALHFFKKEDGVAKMGSIPKKKMV